MAGKLRRYHHLTVCQHFLIPSVVLSNLRDIFLILAGLIQGLTKLIIWRPNVVFAKGGFVCLPVGLAARLLGIPLVIHDSDVYPGLTNRILARFATAIAAGAPLEYYTYPSKKSHYVGIPILSDFHPFSAREQYKAKQQMGLANDKPLIVITGGGLGAKRINQVIVNLLDRLLELGSVVLVSGKNQYDDLKKRLPLSSDHFQLHAFIDNMAQLFGAADVVVTRAGATTILELAALKKPTILIPNAQLTGGHQVKNAEMYNKAKTVVVIKEDELEANPLRLVKEIKSLFHRPAKTKEMIENFGTFARPKAASDVVDIILSVARK